MIYLTASDANTLAKEQLKRILSEKQEIQDILESIKAEISVGKFYFRIYCSDEVKMILRLLGYKVSGLVKEKSRYKDQYHIISWEYEYANTETN